MAKITRHKDTFVTPEARLTWLFCFKPKKFDNGEKFCTDIIFNPAQMDTPEFKAMRAAANDVATEAFGNRLAGMVTAEKFTSPFWKNERKIDATTGKMPEGYEPGGVYITVKCGTRPGVSEHKGGVVVPILDEQEAYPGMWGRVSLDCFAYEDKTSGVSFGLRNILKTRDDQPLGGRRAKPEQDFAGVAAPPATETGGTATAASLF